ncbi:MAG: BREX system P-loop protein BrxC [Chloroflexi bacterium]|nr:BREX system P-loop protein BrxC [Chloroflexota bacterium]
MTQIRSLFSTRRQIDRRIEKVIDYAARDVDRLQAEIEEYEATDSVEANFRRFLETYQRAVQGGQVTEVGVWVSGFYGSGKSSFTKYLGLALDGSTSIGGRPFIDLLSERLHSTDVRALLRTVASRTPTTVIFLDLGAEQLAENASATISSVLYWKVLQWAHYSKVTKLAQLEFTLERLGKYGEFQEKYKARWKEDWLSIHNDPTLANARAAQVITSVLPHEFSSPEIFSKAKLEVADNLRDRAKEMIDLIRNKTGKQNILFLIDEAGQYVAPRQELILNLDGLVRDFKEVGQGKVFVAATGQQTLAEIVRGATYNSPELNKLVARFPIPIELDARDIKEITYRRLLTKTPEGEAQLKALFRTSGQALVAHTRLTGTTLYKTDPDADTFAQFYPFLPQHFDLLLELIRMLARSTGGIGLRSAIKVIQDVLVDVNRLLPRDAIRLADREVGSLACADDFYDSLRADILKVLPHVVSAVDRTAVAFPRNRLAARIAKTVAVLQNIEGFPCTAENIAALLYPAIDSPSMRDQVGETLRKMLAEKELGLIEDPKAGGYVFLSEKVRPLQKKRNEMMPTSGDVNRIRNEILGKKIFDPQPSARLENTKEVKAGVRTGKTLIVGDGEDITFRLEWVDDNGWEARRTELLTGTAAQSDWRNAIAWLARKSNTVEDLLPEIFRSEQIAGMIDDRTADRDEAQFKRAELKRAERGREEVERLLKQALLEGTLIFRGRPTPAGEGVETTDAAARGILAKVAGDVFEYYRLAPIRASSDQAAKFLSVDRLDRMTPELDPLRLVARVGGATRVDVNNAALAETVRAFRTKLDETGGGRLQGSAIQDMFSNPPYGWSKDTVRYLFAALLVSGTVEFHTAEGPLKVAGPKAAEACKNTLAFNRVGVSLRDAPPDPEALDRATRRLEDLFGETVMPLEDAISRAVRKYLPALQEQVASLPNLLRLLGLAGEERARILLASLTGALSGDATNAAAVFGAKETALPEDIRWAREVAKAFDGNAEEDIRAANQLRNRLSEIETLFQGESRNLLPAADMETLTEALRSERFYEQLGSVRAILRAARERTGARYAEIRREVETALHEIAIALESHPSWILLMDDDRSAIMNRLQVTLPLQPGEDDPVRDLIVLLNRRSSLSALQSQLDDEIVRRVPVSPPPDIEVAPKVETLPLASLRPSAVITSEKELEDWLSSLRNRLRALLRAHKHIQIEGVRDEVGK